MHTADLRRRGEDAGLFVTNFPARGWLDYETLRRGRDDLIMVNLVGRRDGGSEVDYTVNPQTGLPFVTGPTVFPRPVNHLLPAWDCIAGQMAVARTAGGGAPSAADRRGPARSAGARRTWRWPCWVISARSPR